MTGFSSTGATRINYTGDIFIDLVPTMLNLLSAADEYIANEVIQNQLYIDDSSFFQLPYIISIIDNVNKNNYTYTSSTKDNLITSIYNIEYKSFMEKKIVTFITYYDIEKQLLNYEIPRELNYYSLEQAIVYVEKNSNNYNYNLLIPQSFYLLDSTDFLLMNFNVTGLAGMDGADPASYTSLGLGDVQNCCPKNCSSIDDCWSNNP